MSTAPQIVVVGCGAIGLPLATAFAARGCDVLGVDIDPTRLAALRAGRPGMLDQGLDAAFAAAVEAGRLAFADRIAPADVARAFILVVPTPVDADGKPVLANVEAGVDAIMAAAHDGDLLLLRATVPVGTTRRIAGTAVARGRKLRVAACPDRSVAGRCFLEQFAVPHLVGGIDGAATRAAAALLARLGATVAVSSPEVAEAAKLFANVQRDVTFALANQLALAADALALDFGEIVAAAGEGYARFALARPGPVGGPCLSKDSALLAHSLGGTFDLGRAARALNESLLDHVAQAVARHVDGRAHPVVAVLGLAFKGDPPSADRRGAFGVALAARLRADLAHATLRLGEPTADDPAERDLARAVAGADVVVIANDHPLIRALDPPTLARSLRGGALIYDACCALALVAQALPNAVTLRRIGGGGYAPAAMASKRAR